MNTINSLPIDFDQGENINIYRNTIGIDNSFPDFTTQSEYKSPFNESMKPQDDSLLKLTESPSIFANDYSYTIHVKTFASGAEVLKQYYEASPEEREIIFFCEESDPSKSNLFKTFILVKYGKKYKELVYALKSKSTAGVVSKRKNSTVGVKISTFEDEVIDNFNIITKNFSIDTDMETIQFVMDNELKVTSSNSKTISELYGWYNNSISFIVEGINGWLNQLKFKDYQPDKTNDKDKDESTFDNLIPDSIEKFITDTFESALSKIQGYAKEKLPQSWINFLKKAYNTIKGILRIFKTGMNIIADMAKEAFYIFRAFLMGFVNGLLSTIETILSLIGWLLKKNGNKALTGENYREFKNKLEFIEDFIDLVNEKANDVFEAIGNLTNDISLDKLIDTLSVFKDKFKDTTIYDCAYFAGLFIFEVVVGVILAFFTGGATLVAEAANATEKAAAILKLFLREIISTATFGVLEILKLFKIIITRFVIACKNGWKGFKQFLRNLFKNKTDEIIEEEGKVLDDLIKLSDEAEGILQKYADNAVLAYTKNERPSMVSILSRDDKMVLAYSNKSGLKHNDLPQGLHPLVKEWLEKISDLNLRSRPQHGKCAEPAAISKWLWEIDPKGKMKINTARKEFEGVMSKAKAIKGTTFKSIHHGEIKPACKSCNPLLKYFNIKELN